MKCARTKKVITKLRSCVFLEHFRTIYICVLHLHDTLLFRCRAKLCLLQVVTAVLDMPLQNTCTTSASQSSLGVS